MYDTVLGLGDSAVTLTHCSETEKSLYSRGEISTQNMILEGKGIITVTKIRKREREKERREKWVVGGLRKDFMKEIAMKLKSEE